MLPVKKNRKSRNNVIIDIICSLLAVLFIYATVSKLIKFSDFKAQLGKSPFITRYAGFIAFALPSIEIIAVLLLAAYKTRLWGLYLSLFLMSLFTAYLIAMLNLSYYIPCSCGGVLSALSWKQHIFFNLFFLSISIIGILIIKDPKDQSTIPKLNIFKKLSADKGVAENL